MRRWLVLALVVVVAAMAFFGWRQRRTLDAVLEVLRSDEADGRELTSADDVWSYLAAHPDRYALAFFEVGEEASGVFHDADTRWPLASTVKLVPLAVASRRLAEGSWREETPIAGIDRFLLPGTDGQAHAKATSALGEFSTAGAALTAMIEFSDNAATDAVLFSLGRDALTRDVPALGALDVPHPLSGTMLLSLEGEPPDAGSIDERAWALAAALREDAARAPSEAARLSEQTVRAQLEMARTFDNRGTARAFARLMESILADPRSEYGFARDRLSWPLRRDGNAGRFRRWGVKGGSLPGVLTSAAYVETNSGKQRVLALFLHDLPFATWLALSRSAAQQAVELEVLSADDPAALLRQKLGQ